MSPRGITATRLSSGRYDGRAPLPIPAGVRLSPQPCLFAIKSDDGFRARFLKDAAAALREYSLSDEDAAAIVRRDRDGLLARGAHPYLVFMADLRLRMEREPVSFEFF